jgi:hypothetical protein
MNIEAFVLDAARTSGVTTQMRRAMASRGECLEVAGRGSRGLMKVALHE